MSLPGIGVLPLEGFQRPALLLFGLVPVGLFGLYMWVAGRRRERLRRFTDVDVPQPRRRHVPIAVALLSLVLLTVALATPTHEMRIPRNRAVVMLVIDMSNSMRATDIAPNRLKAAEQAATEFATHLTPGINLGLVGFAGIPYLLVPPTPTHQSTIDALQKLQFADSTATGEAILSALHAISAASGIGGDTPPPARIVLLSDGGENKPTNPTDPHDGAYTAARLAKDQGVPISTVAFGTPNGSIDIDGQRVAVPVKADQLKTIAKLSGGRHYEAGNLTELNAVYGNIEQDIGYRVVPGPGSAGWLRLGAITAGLAAVLGLVINRRLPV